MAHGRQRVARQAAAMIGAAALAAAAGAGVPVAGIAGSGDDGVAPLLGFSSAAAAAERALEERFDADVSAADERAWMQRLSAAPNQVGSPHDLANAQYIRRLFSEFGWDASVETFQVLYPTPREIAVELVAPTHVVAKLREPAVAGDATSAQTEDVLPPYNVYGADGDVTAPLVYVNRGMPDDYVELERQGVSVRGRIVLVRYGGGFRGLKPKLAFEHGAVGCLIYSDPRDDGYGAGDVYPEGGYRPRDAVQRGSVEDLTLYSGDPLAPGEASVPGAKRLAPAAAAVIQKIPVVPMSYADAEPLIAALGGRVAPESWRGGLPLVYHLGPGAAQVHMKVRSDWSQRTLYDVIAKLPGSALPDQWIIRGNHHDAWVFGASDPISGTVAMLSEAKAIGRLAKAGWRPRRTLIYASWDGEEAGLLGSTEWVEAHAAELGAKALLYVNSDMNERGPLKAGGSHSLQRLVAEAARDVADPETGASMLARATAAARIEHFEAGRGAADSPAPWRLGALGSGSDYTPFLQHAGINALDLGLGGESDYGVYHSAYDSFDHFRRFVDPSFEYGAALAKVAGRIVLRSAEADVLPLQTADFAQETAAYDEELHQLADGMRHTTRELTKLLDDQAFTIAADPLRARAPPQREADVPFLKFAELDNAVEKLKASTQAFDRLCARAAEAPGAQGAALRQRLNAALAALESSLTDARGLPGRPWYRHMIYAPGARTGYGAKTLPGIREAIEARRFGEADEYLGVVAARLDAYRAILDRALAREAAPGS